MKEMKSDAVFDFSSDSLMNASNKLIDHVTTLFKRFLATGKIPDFLLLCTLVPIVKDNLDDIAIRDNYRAIAIGSLILKWFDWLLLILNSDKLTSDHRWASVWFSKASQYNNVQLGGQLCSELLQQNSLCLYNGSE